MGQPGQSVSQTVSVIERLRCWFWCPIVGTLLAGSPVGAQVDDSTPPGPSASPDVSAGSSRSEAVAPLSNSSGARKAAKDEVIINASKTPLPQLPPDQFVDCMRRTLSAESTYDPVQGVFCQAQLNQEKRVVIVACVNYQGDTAPPRVIQACTELLDRQIFEGRDRFPIFADRARAHFAQGESAQALEDYAEAIKLAPNQNKIDLYYARGLVYAAQSDDAAALRDFDAAIGAHSNSVPALRQRARIYEHQNNFSRSLQDYVEALRLQPQNAVLWSERGYVSLRNHDFPTAVKEEAQAISLDPKLAWAYFLRGTAFGNLGDSGHASSDINTAVALDPSLAQYVLIKDKTASLLLPPPPG